MTYRAREYTCRVREAVDQNLLNKDMLIDMMLQWMHESDVQAMCEDNNICLDDEEDEEENDDHVSWVNYDYDTLDGRLLIKDLGGNCPVQAEGTICGEPFYFRARGCSWSMSIGGSDLVINPNWYHSENYGEGAFDAGWMPESEALVFIQREAARWIAEKNNC